MRSTEYIPSSPVFVQKFAPPAPVSVTPGLSLSKILDCTGEDTCRARSESLQQGVWGQSLQRASGVRGRSPPEAKSCLAFEYEKKEANLPSSLYFATLVNDRYL